MLLPTAAPQHPHPPTHLRCAATPVAVPNIPTIAPKKKKGFFGGKKAAAAAAEQEAAAAVRFAAATATTVEVHTVNEEAGSQVGWLGAAAPPCAAFTCCAEVLTGCAGSVGANLPCLPCIRRLPGLLPTAPFRRAAPAPHPHPLCLLPCPPGPQFVATHEVRLGGDQPVLLHGGGLLGVVLNKPAPGGAGGWAARAPAGAGQAGVARRGAR